MNTHSETAQSLKIEVINFIKFIRDILNDEEYHFKNKHSVELMFLETIFNTMSCTDLMNRFIKNVLPYEEQINNKQEEFFIKNAYNIFETLPKEKVQFVHDLFVKDVLQPSDKELVWQYWITFVNLAQKNKKDK